MARRARDGKGQAAGRRQIMPKEQDRYPDPAVIAGQGRTHEGLTKNNNR
jgi:hypothetical protein